MIYCAIDGKETNVIPSDDRGLSYGDGLFTTAKISNGKVMLFDMHLERLAKGSEKLGFEFRQVGTLKRQLEALAKRYELAVLKVILTAGSGGRGYARAAEVKPRVIVSIYPYPESYVGLRQNGISMGLAETELGLNPMTAGIKHLNRLEQVFLKAEVAKSSYDDLVVTDLLGNVVESTLANLFWFKDNHWFTPVIDNSGVNGLIRQYLLNLPLQIQQVKVTPKALESVEAMFVSNALAGIIPVHTYCDNPLSMEPVALLANEVAPFIEGIMNES